MSNTIDTTTALEILMADAERIYQLITKQQATLCLAQCPAFEEIVDTQMFGFSKQVMYATQIGVITEEEGHRILSDLEKALNSVYTALYDEVKGTNKGE